VSSHPAILILAAGASVRLGRSKQLLEFEGESLIARAVRIASESRIGPIYIVIAAGEIAVEEQLGNHEAIHMLANPAPHLGIGSSIKIGVHHIAQTAADSVLIMLCDQPRVTSRLLKQLAAAKQSAAAAACRYGQTIGVPAVFGRELFRDLSEIPDESGAKVVLDRHSDSIATIDFPAAEFDVDTVEDVARLK
jgi:CTP:molybdopterin cytidylyltransferase MocA